MITKNTHCLYCGAAMESKTAKKKFCSPKCKVYYGRELERGTLTPPKKEIILRTLPKPEPVFIKPEVIEISQFDAYSKEIKGAEHEYELTAIMNSVKSDKALDFGEKSNLERLARSVAKDFHNLKNKKHGTI